MEDRNLILGGSDIAAAMGLSPYKTRLQLWAEKTGAVKAPDLSDNEAVEMGIELEEVVARLFTKRTGLTVRRAPQRYFDSEYSWMSCQVDRLVTGTDMLLECKTASSRKEKEWENDEIPKAYIVQVMWQLMITGRSTGYIAALIGGQKFVYRKIEADIELIEAIRKAAKEFWQMVVDKTAPLAVVGDDEVLLQLHPQSNEQLQNIQTLNDSIKLRQELSAHIKELEKQQEEIDIKLKEVIGDNLGFTTSEYIVKWSPYNQTRTDVEKLKQDNLFSKYSKTIQSRRLTVTKNKGESHE